MHNKYYSINDKKNSLTVTATRHDGDMHKKKNELLIFTNIR